MAGSADDEIVSFERPPLVEVVCGVQFQNIGLQTGHLGKFWQQVQDEYPTTQDAPPLPSVTESFGGMLDSFSWTNLPDLRRVCLINETQGHLLQIQANRFHRNWRQVADDVYPRFGQISSEFIRNWTAFAKFVKAAKLPEPSVNQVELTYVNHVTSGPLWDTDGMAKLLPWLAPVNIAGRKPEAEILLHYDVKEVAGRLHVSIRPAQRQDGSKIVVIELTARGAIVSSDEALPERWLARAHAVVVGSFAQLTGPDAHTFWGRSK
jgi:uncharacterized protein (TIGR04255 family)